VAATKRRERTGKRIESGDAVAMHTHDRRAKTAIVAKVAPERSIRSDKTGLSIYASRARERAETHYKMASALALPHVTLVRGRHAARPMHAVYGANFCPYSP